MMPRENRSPTRAAVAVLILAALMLGGCAATPEGTQDGGVQRAMTEPEQRAAEVAAPESGAAAVFAEDGRQVDAVLQGEDGFQLPVKARLSVPRAEAITEFELKRQFMTDVDMMLGAFFGEDKARAVKTIDPEAELDEEWVLDYGDGRKKYLSWSSRTGREGPELDYSISYGYNDGSNASLRDKSDEELEAMPTMDAGDALPILERQMQKFGVPGVTVTDADPSGGRLMLSFYPRYSSFQVASSDGYGGGSTEDVAYFSLSDMTSFGWRSSFMQNERAVEALITADQALEAARAHLGTVLTPPPGRAVDLIELRHQYIYDEGKAVLIARPVWYCHMPVYAEGYVPSDDYSKPNNLKTYTGSFTVDAQNARVEVIDAAYAEENA